MRVLTVIFFLQVATCVHAHSVHTSTAEAEYNAKTKKLEVSLTVFVSDLELALVRQSEREMRIDKTPVAEFDAQIQAYLVKNFVVTDAAGKVAKMTWVGREMEKESEKSGDPAVVLFFEVEMPEGVQGAMVRDGVFCEMFKDQANLVELKSGGRKVEMRFGDGDDSKKIEAIGGEDHRERHAPCSSTDRRTQGDRCGGESGEDELTALFQRRLSPFHPWQSCESCC